MQRVYFLPLFTFTLSILFSITLYFHWRRKKEKTYLLWWLIGVLTFGAGTFTESFNTLFSWHEWNFRWWYVTGALLGGAPLAQGTVYLLMKRKTAHLLTVVLLLMIITASVCVFLSPIDYGRVNPVKMSGNVFVWQWVRYFSPFINTYALIFLVGGAIYSANQLFRKKGIAKKILGKCIYCYWCFTSGHRRHQYTIRSRGSALPYRVNRAYHDFYCLPRDAK